MSAWWPSTAARQPGSNGTLTRTTAGPGLDTRRVIDASPARSTDAVDGPPPAAERGSAPGVDSRTTAPSGSKSGPATTRSARSAVGATVQSVNAEATAERASSSYRDHPSNEPASVA